MESSRIDFLSRPAVINSSDMSRSIEQGKDSDFDSLLILDRNVDLLSLMRTQLTYEGLMDEIFSINSGFVELEAKYFAGSGHPLNGQKTKKLLLNSNDVVFAAIRDQTFESNDIALNFSGRRSLKQCCTRITT